MHLLRQFKKIIYFWVAAYFGFFASVVLRRSKPTIITVTGSSGKTTLLHMFEAQLGDKAMYSHKANSAFGIPFNILGLERKSFSLLEWPVLVLLAPFRAFRTLPKKIYVTEADAERPGEGAFVARLLKPDVLVWLSLEEAHGVNYDKKVAGQYSFENLKKVIAHEFGEFVAYTKQMVVLNADNPFIQAEASRVSAQTKTVLVHTNDVRSFEPKKDSVVFETNVGSISVPKLMPEEAGLSVVAIYQILKFLGLAFDFEFKNLDMPPSRSTVFEGKKNTVLIDSSYNATFDGMRAMLNLFKKYPAGDKKWLVLGDMIEEGKSEAYEHGKLATMIQAVGAHRIILVGPRLQKYTLPKLHLLGIQAESFLYPDQALEYVNRTLVGEETLLFKGARFLEFIVEGLLHNPGDAQKLCRREPVWQKRRVALSQKKSLIS